MKITDVFNETKTHNGDIAYCSSKNKYLDLMFSLVKYRNNPNLISISLDKNNEYDKIFARLIRDPRIGLGEREVGRKLLLQIEEEPEVILNVGRADDIFYMGEKEYKLKGKNKYWDFLKNYLIGELNNLSSIKAFNLSKWMPRLRKNKKQSSVIKFLNYINIDNTTYRKLISNPLTTESIISRGDTVKDYSKVTSLAIKRYHKNFMRNDGINYLKYLDEVKEGKAKINTKVLTPYDIIKSFYNESIDEEMANILFNNLEEVKLGKIIPIVDGSGSMYDDYNSYLKARAIGHYVAKNSSYMNNHIITFSSYPKLLKLGDNYSDDMDILDSFNDASNTDFGKVMNILSKVTEDLPDYLLVLSDMHFDKGSNNTKEEAMKILKSRNKNLKIIWWNLCSSDVVFPETDEYGNIFLGGYNPLLLKFLKVGFNGEQLLNELIENYKINYDKTYN